MFEEFVDILVIFDDDEAQFTNIRSIMANKTASIIVDSQTSAKLNTYTLLPTAIPDWRTAKDAVSEE